LLFFGDKCAQENNSISYRQGNVKEGYQKHTRFKIEVKEIPKRSNV